MWVGHPHVVSPFDPEGAPPHRLPTHTDEALRGTLHSTSLEQVSLAVIIRVTYAGSMLAQRLDVGPTLSQR